MKIENLEQCCGKKFVGFANTISSDGLILVFEDCFVVIEPSHGDDAEPCLEILQNFDPRELSNEDNQRLGMFPKEELNKLCKEEEDRIRKGQSRFR